MVAYPRRIARMTVPTGDAATIDYSSIGPILSCQPSGEIFRLRQAARMHHLAVNGDTRR